MIFRQLAKDSAVYGGADFLSKVISFISFPLIAAAMSPLEFGTLELLLTMTALLGMVANCGLNNALQRFYWDSVTPPEQRPILVSSGLAALFLLLVGSAGFGAAAIGIFRALTGDWHAPIGWVGVMAGLVLMFASQLVQYLLDVTRLHMAPWRFAGIALISRVMTSAAGVFAVISLGLGLDGLIAAQALLMLAAIPLAMYTVRSDLTARIDADAARKLMQFGYPFIYVSLAFWLFGSMDRWLLASLSTVAEVGIYSVAHRFATVILFVSLAFGQAWSPLAIKIRTDHPGNYRHVYTDVFVAFSSLMLLLGGTLALFAPEIIGVLMPSEYGEASSALAALSLGLVMQATTQVTAIGISLENKTYLFSRLSWLATALNLVLNLAMIPSLGALGAAAATSLSYLFLTAAYLYYTQRLHPLPFQWPKLLALLASWLALVGCVIGLEFEHPLVTPIWGRTLVILACLALYVLVVPWGRYLRGNG